MLLYIYRIYRTTFLFEIAALVIVAIVLMVIRAKRAQAQNEEPAEPRSQGHRAARSEIRVPPVWIGITLTAVAVFVGFMAWKMASAMGRNSDNQHMSVIQQPTSVAAEPSSSAWQYLQSSDEAGVPVKAYLNPGTAACSAEGVVTVWEKFIYGRGTEARMSALRYLKERGRPYDEYTSTHIQVEVDCRNRAYRQIRLGFFDERDNEIGHDTATIGDDHWREMPRRSIADEVANTACSLKECM